MTIRNVTENTWWVGSIDWDRRLFDELIPLPNGTSYNSYFIKGSDKNLLVDTVSPEKEDDLLNNLNKLGVDSIDFVVANHGEQDHSGSLRKIVDKFGAKVITSDQGKDTVTSLVNIGENEVEVVKDGDEIGLGNLDVRFMIAPWVHWPDTMFTYLKQDEILFTCDYLGSHYATSKLFVDDFEEIRVSAKKYFAEIMMPFSNKTKSYLDDIKEIDPNVIAPSHGPLYNDPDMILEAYEEWVSSDMKNKVVIPYVSMHGSTERMVEYFADSLIDKGVEVDLFHMTKSDIGNLAMASVDAATVVIGSPMVLGGAHPVMFYVSYLVNALKPNTKYLSIIGSFGWGGRMINQLKDNLSSLNAKLLDPVKSKGYPNKKNLEALDELADKISSKHNEDDEII